MHWEALVLYGAPRDIILNGEVFIGAAVIEVGECAVAVKDLQYQRASLEDAAIAVGYGMSLLIAYPSTYMDAVAYFLARRGIPRHSLRVVNADPRMVPLRSAAPIGVLRNIAYLHGVKRVVIGKKLHRWARKTSYAIHALLMASGYNADKDLARRYGGSIPCRVKLA